MSMQHEDLLSLVERLRRTPREAETVEFKSNWDRPEDIGASSPCGGWGKFVTLASEGRPCGCWLKGTLARSALGI